ncbi:MAG: hypothetical protein WCI65_10975 [Synechococcaceae cyanobacterium ELA263]
MSSQRRGQLAGLGAAVLFGCSAPLISTITESSSALSIAGLLYGGATMALLMVRLMRGKGSKPRCIGRTGRRWQSSPC